MFRIDLKASASRRAADLAESTTTGTPLLAFAPVALALVGLVVVLRISASWWDASIAERRDEVKSLQADVAASRQHVAALGGQRRALFLMQEPETYWSDQLRLLSERISDKLWLTRVAVIKSGGGEDQPAVRTLAIEGGVLSSQSEGNLDLIGQFIRSVQSDERFREAFGEINLESVTRGGSDSYSLNFVLRAPFRI